MWTYHRLVFVGHPKQGFPRPKLGLIWDVIQGKWIFDTKNGTHCLFSCQDFVFQHWLVILLPFQPAQKSLVCFCSAKHHDKIVFLGLVLQTFAAKGKMQGENCPRNEFTVFFFSQSNHLPLDLFDIDVRLFRIFYRAFYNRIHVNASEIQ